jgi:hypothetical protein
MLKPFSSGVSDTSSHLRVPWIYAKIIPEVILEPFLVKLTRLMSAKNDS